MGKLWGFIVMINVPLGHIKSLKTDVQVVIQVVETTQK